MTSNTFSFQPWTRSNAEEQSLKDVLARVNLERGHFRDITEASLQEEIAAEGGLELSESEEEDEDEEDGEEAQKGKGKSAMREDLFKAKYEMLASVAAAEQEILMSLDFVSLLLSKDAPKQAQSTISPFLKETVPLGSLGTDLWQRMAVDKARNAQDELLAANVRMKGLQHSADDLLSAASRLQDNVQKETQYWDQILSISEKGWNVCRIPGQQHRLGVRFGSSESVSEFSRRGIAALSASSDGSIALERGIGSKPKALHAVLRKNGKVVGSSKLPSIPDADKTTLEARIRYARDSLYDEELYHEMIRESRTLAPLGVGMKGSALRFGSSPMVGTGMHVSLDLVSLGEDHGLNIHPSSEEDALAQAIILAARLLLSQGHREKLKNRSEIPPPMSDKQKDEGPTLPILRPIMSFVLHRSAVDQLNAYVETVTSLLGAAHVNITDQSARYGLPKDAVIDSTEALVTTLMQPWISEAMLNIASHEGDMIFGFKIETTLAHAFGSVFTITVPSCSEVYRFETIDEFLAATDSNLASALASALAPKIGDEWECDEPEALLTKDTRFDEKSQAMWVTLDSGSKTLSLNSLVKKVLWRAEGDSSLTGFWDAYREVLEVEK